MTFLSVCKTSYKSKLSSSMSLVWHVAGRLWPGSDVEQVVHTHVPFLPSSIVKTGKENGCWNSVHMVLCV